MKLDGCCNPSGGCVSCSDPDGVREVESPDWWRVAWRSGHVEAALGFDLALKVRDVFAPFREAFQGTPAEATFEDVYEGLPDAVRAFLWELGEIVP